MNLAAFQSAQRAYDNMAEPECEERSMECDLDGHVVLVEFDFGGIDEIWIKSVEIAGLVFDGYSFSDSTNDDLVRQIRKVLA